MTLTVVSAERGRGKTTWVCVYADAAVRAGRTVGGIAAPAMGAGGRRVGYDLLDLRTGRRRPLARTVRSAAEVPTIGEYRFDDAAWAEGEAAVRDAVEAGLNIIVIDEVGPLEMQGRGWAAALTQALAACSAEQELVVVVRTALRDALPERFPSPWWTAARQVTLL
jgi:nucleoside-triphosphatase